VGLKITHKTGTDQEIEMLREPSIGLFLQDPTGQVQQDDMGGTDLAGDADAVQLKASFGTPFIIEVTIDGEETGGAATGVLTALEAGGTDIFPVYDAEATALTTGSPFKFKVLDCHCILLDESAGSAADTLQLMKVDDDGTTETAITDAMSLNEADDALVRAAVLDQDACVIDVTENLRLDLVLANSSNHATSVKVVVTAMRCIADE
jgi:hypothetical protein